MATKRLRAFRKARDWQDLAGLMDKSGFYIVVSNPKRISLAMLGLLLEYGNFQCLDSILANRPAVFDDDGREINILQHLFRYHCTNLRAADWILDRTGTQDGSKSQVAFMAVREKNRPRLLDVVRRGARLGTHHLWQIWKWGDADFFHEIASFRPVSEDFAGDWMFLVMRSEYQSTHPCDQVMAAVHSASMAISPNDPWSNCEGLLWRVNEWPVSGLVGGTDRACAVKTTLLRFLRSKLARVAKGARPTQ